ncbi:MULTISPECIES: hypothetical protein [Treponema]|uniref:hypothetical protein n=1 Tax=Treponema TaxID=157 RepID=UPI0020A36671|nr:hypothetical protein [Treponema denticola]UTC86877.1 hypothetical protein E4N79_01425 [Treponema denticola]
MARPRKSTSELKLKGTYRDDRHKDRAIVEKEIAELSSFKQGTKIEPPKSLTDKYVVDYFKSHTSLLVSLQILHPVDLPELELLYETLQQVRDVNRQLKKIDMVKDFVMYEKLTKLSLKLSMRFSQLASKYYISPSARTHLELDNLELKNKKLENQSIVQKLINKK